MGLGQSDTFRKVKMKTPGFAYPGGKARARQWILDHAPISGRRYIEPFAGRGNVFFLARTTLDFREWYLNDRSTYDFLRAIQTKAHTFPTNWYGIGTREQYNYFSRLPPTAPDYSVALMAEPPLTFAGGGWDAGFNDSSKHKDRFCFGRYRETLQVAQNLLHSVKLSCDDFTAFLDSLDLESNDFVYLDPPYMGTNNKGYDDIGLNYPRFAERLARAKYRWVLTEYANSFYTQYLGRPIAERETISRSDTSNSLKRTEYLWRNF